MLTKKLLEPSSDSFCFCIWDMNYLYLLLFLHFCKSNTLFVTWDHSGFSDFFLCTIDLVLDSIRPLHATSLFLYLLKTSENHRFSVLRGYRKSIKHEMGSAIIIKMFSKNYQFHLIYSKQQFYSPLRLVKTDFKFSPFVSLLHSILIQSPKSFKGLVYTIMPN